MHALGVSGGHELRLAETALTLARLLREDVALEGPHPLQLASTGPLEALRGSPVRFHLRHLSFSISPKALGPGPSLVRLLQRGDYHRHHAPLHVRVRLDLPDVHEGLCDSREDLQTDLGMGDLTTPKHHRQLHLVAFVQEAAGMTYLELVVVLLNTRPELHFLDLDRVLLFPRFAGCPGCFVLELPVVHHLDHGWPGLRSDLSQIHPTYRGPFPGLVDRDDADLFTIVLDEPYWADPNLVVDASTLVDFLLPPMECMASTFRHSSIKKPETSLGPQPG